MRVRLVYIKTFTHFTDSNRREFCRNSLGFRTNTAKRETLLSSVVLRRYFVKFFKFLLNKDNVGDEISAQILAQYPESSPFWGKFSRVSTITDTSILTAADINFCDELRLLCESYAETPFNNIKGLPSCETRFIDSLKWNRFYFHKYFDWEKLPVGSGNSKRLYLLSLAIHDVVFNYSHEFLPDFNQFNLYSEYVRTYYNRYFRPIVSFNGLGINSDEIDLITETCEPLADAFKFYDQLIQDRFKSRVKYIQYKHREKALYNLELLTLWLKLKDDEIDKRELIRAKIQHELNKYKLPNTTPLRDLIDMVFNL